MNWMLWKEESNIKKTICVTLNSRKRAFSPIATRWLLCDRASNWKWITITQEREMCVAAVISGGEQAQNSPVQHELHSTGEVHVLPCRDKKGHKVRRGENFINQRGLNMDLFGWGLKPCYTLGRAGAEMEPQRDKYIPCPSTPMPWKAK